MASDELPENDAHVRPEGVSDDLVYAVGRVTQALETIERARGALYDFHQLVGYADLELDDAVDTLIRCGHPEMAELIEKDLIGRNVIDGRWTFQIVEEFEETYYDMFRHVEKNVRDRLMDGKRHVRESDFKERRRTRGHKAHEARP
jgi:hypothetical protein